MLQLLTAVTAVKHLLGEPTVASGTAPEKLVKATVRRMCVPDVTARHGLRRQ